MSEALRPAGEDRWALTFVRNIAHPPEKVWRAVTEPRHLSRWYPMVVERLEPRVGGTVTFRDEEGTVVPAEVTEVDPPRTFALREHDEETGEHDLRFVLEEDGAGGCRLTFTHTFADRTWADRTETGWSRCLDELERILDESD
ncbi:SRPBCC domain-containing protein [Nocardiopsis sp. MG754419]|uniref:SRPBCC domain-containing protein n=1 Tax=Nocardiopsis sp. MG754419 TaxID=2259865 RepID=UPI001BA5C21D|nr:SRPBCC domain-containing protein [Nocardiopsis sp. MG754419]MBR8743047.1 hypothetical protein [Nocardiopsis sp. MG754419]